MNHRLRADSTDVTPLTQAEITDALAALMGRLDLIDTQVGTHFPLYSIGTQNQWKVSTGGSWMGGYWAGCWWLRAKVNAAQVNAAQADQNKAIEIARRLAEKNTLDTINRSMIFYYGAALGARWHVLAPGVDMAEMNEMARIAAKAIAESYHPELQCIPVGNALGAGEQGNRSINVDALAATLDLLTISGDISTQALARRHLDTILNACATASGAWHSTAIFEAGHFKPLDHAGVWSRGQAWSLLGLAKAAAIWGEPYLTHASHAGKYWSDSRSQNIPLNSLNQAGGMEDPSATVIAAIAMLLLADVLPEQEGWHAAARQQIALIIRSPYFIGMKHTPFVSKCTDTARPAAGIFWGSCYRTGPDTLQLVESVWASFFLMEALCILAGIIEAKQC